MTPPAILGRAHVRTARRSFGAATATALLISCAQEEPSSGDNLPPSCVQLASRCGTAQESCCETLPVPASTYDRFEPAFEGPPLHSPATISALHLDKYEVTVGRFRRFMSIFDAWRAAGNPRPGTGAHPKIPGTGWQEAWMLAQTTAELQIPKQCLGMRLTWSEAAAGAESFPINCINWFEAFAFCIWDGGRLATEAEWELAATGGEPRRYPWGDAEPLPSLASYGCEHAGSSEDCAREDIPEVGALPAGNGPFGHADLAGGMYEWVFDRYLVPYPPVCEDCAVNSDNPKGNLFRVMRGGSWSHHMVRLETTMRYGDSSGGHGDYTGIRCARDL
jgi:sulfatase modifying factor 1